MHLSFYPTEIDYTIRNGKAIVQLFGRTAEGEQIVVLDEEFEPYFYVVGSPNLDELQDLQDADNKVVRVEKVIKNLNEKEIEAFKVFTNIPKAVPIIKDKAIQLVGVEDVYEYDILFVRRYLIDKHLTPLIKTEVECEEVQSEFKVPAFSAKSIVCESEEVLQPKMLAVDIETYNPDNRMNTKKNPILMLGLYGKDFKRVITWKKFQTEEPWIEFVPTESDALMRFVELIAEYSPDMLVGYFTDGFDFPYIVERAKTNKIRLDIGLDHSGIDIRGKTQSEAKIVGIAHIDIFKFIRRVIGRSMKTDSFSLDAVAKELLGESKHEVDIEGLAKAWDKTSQVLEEYCRYNLQDCKLTYDLVEKVLPNLIEFVRIIRLPPHDINRMSFSIFVEWYLINQACARNEIVLNKPQRREESDRLADRIQGAFVFEPTPGFYKKIAVFDFRSLYPSIIASHNISKGTFNCACCKGSSQEIKTERGTFWFCKNKKGLFSSVIGELITRRGSIKKQLKSSKDLLLAARSEALKVLANSFYGYMAFAPARWYCIECAESTTAFARKYIHQAIETAQKERFRVLYSDTDSIFLLLENKTKEDSLALMERINKDLPGIMELDYEGFYPAGIFVGLKAGEGGAKKKYALIDEKGKMKIRGFETIRRNSSVIAKEVQGNVLKILLKEYDPKKAKAYVRQVVDDLRTNKLPIESVIITTALSKSTDAYAAIGPHVAAAQRMESKGQQVGSGTIIQYVVTKGKGKIRDKVRLPDEAKQNDYDGEYYITNQVVPGIERIFAVLDIPVDDLLSTTKQSSLAGF
ncbi:MAG TPA: DNA-directed DNA polymerase [Candidatus Nanoarchaeia archaeon]|nr:DNA-directed DNA polymerase [Candidatus Nanoarchaeia archaeon]